MYRASELKEMCRERGLKVSGNKSELVDRLRNPSSAKTTKKSSKPKNSSSSTRRMSCAQVDQALRDAGYEDPKEASSCVKKGIQKGYISLDGGLDKVIYSGGKCYRCNYKLSCTLRQLLDQPDYVGYGGTSGGGNDEDAPLQCENCMENGEPYGMYLTHVCEGGMNLNNGSFLNHCTECPGTYISLYMNLQYIMYFWYRTQLTHTSHFSDLSPGFGKCIGDYREVHCEEEGCNRHYWAVQGAKCDKCHPGFDPFDDYY